MVKNTWAGAVLWVCVGIFAGNHPSAAAADSVRELRIQLPTEPVSLDPATADDDFAARVLSNTMDGLVGYDGAGKLENRLTQSYKISGDRKTYAFALRKDAVWSDGKPVTAGDFVLGIRRTLDPKTGAKLANMLFPIRGAREFNAGKGSVEDVRVSSKNGELVIELEKPAPYFVHVLAMAQASPARADVLAANAGRWPETAPVTGPYFIDSHILEQSIHLAPNPKYWHFKKEQLPVDLKIIPEESTAEALFESGKLDVVTRVAPTDYARLKGQGDVAIFPQAATYFLSFNTRKAPFDDREWRRAIAGSLNRDELMASLIIPNRPADGWIPDDVMPKRKLKLGGPGIFASSVQSVAAKLKIHPVSVTASFNMNAVNSMIMEKLQADALKRLGMNVLLDHLDWKSYVSLVRSDAPQIYRFQRGAPFMDPVWHLVSFKGDDANNPTGWKNAEYDRLVDQVIALPMGSRRQAAVEKAEKILTQDDAVVVPLFFPNQVFLVSKRVQGFRANPINVTLFSEMTLK